MIELLSGYLGGLKNAEHYGVVTQLNNPIQALKTDNAVYRTATEALQAAFTAEDVAYKKTQKDWNVERLKVEDKKMDNYMVSIHTILNGYMALPDREPMKQTAKELLQLWKDFRFKTNESYSGETAKVINICQEVEKRKADAEAIGVWEYFEKARTEALNVQNLLSLRFDELASHVAGELREARTHTDAAVKQVFQVINSLQVLAPSAEIDTLVHKLKAIEEYVRRYYLKAHPTTDDTNTEPTDPDAAGNQTDENNTTGTDEEAKTDTTEGTGDAE